MIKLICSPEFLFVAKNATEKKTVNRKEFPNSGETEEIGCAQVVSLKSATSNWKNRKKGKHLFLPLAVANFKTFVGRSQQIWLCLCVH